jgi:hypothetical protein
MGDIYGLLKLPYALTAWVAAAFCAPALGPLLSGFSVVVKGWRWALWEVRRPFTQHHPVNTHLLTKYNRSFGAQHQYSS